MRLFFKRLVLVLGALVIAAISACGGSGGDTSSSPASATLRIVNASNAATLAVSVNGASIQTGVAPASTSSYSSLASGLSTLTITSTTGSLTSVTQNVNLSSGAAYTVVAYERKGALYAYVITENQIAPAAGYGLLSIANLSQDAGPLDIYVVTPGTTSLVGLSPTFPFVQGTTGSTTLVAGTFDIIATKGGNPDSIRFSLPGVVLSSTQIYTLALSSTSGGALVNGVLITQGGAAQFAPNTNARVRLVSALPAAGATPVTGSVGTADLGAVYAPNQGIYTLVTGDTSTYTINVAGSPVSAPAATFAAGGDYTILVYGTSSAPHVSVFTDDNHQASGGQEKLRLVNAAVTAPGGLSLYDDGIQVANSLAYGSASGYVGMDITSSGTSVLQVVAPSLTSVSATFSPVSGAVYTVFVLDASLTPYVFRDR